MVKAVEQICHREVKFPRSRSASLGFANADTNSDNCGGDPSKSSGVTSCAYPGGQGFSPCSGTDDEMVGHGCRGPQGGVGYICVRGGWQKNV